MPVNCFTGIKGASRGFRNMVSDALCTTGCASAGLQLFYYRRGRVTGNFLIAFVFSFFAALPTKRACLLCALCIF